MLIKQLVYLKKWELRNWNLGQIFKTELWMVGQLYFLQRQIAQKIIELKIQACPVNAGH